MDKQEQRQAIMQGEVLIIPYPNGCIEVSKRDKAYKRDVIYADKIAYSTIHATLDQLLAQMARDEQWLPRQSYTIKRKEQND